MKKNIGRKIAAKRRKGLKPKKGKKELSPFELSHPGPRYPHTGHPFS